MGLGLHGGGIGTVRFLSSVGAKLVVTDLKSKEELAPALEKLKGLKNVEYVLGQHRIEDFTDTDMVIKTPPAPWTSAPIKAALKKNIPVEVDSSLFFKLCVQPIIGVTGTKGKTTTSTLIYEILKQAGKNPVKVGIGQISVLDKLKDLKKDSVVIFELSSWRLSALGRYRLSPRVAVITNIFPDHLNYYKTMEDYFADKKFICSSQKAREFCVLNWDDPKLSELEPEIKSQIVKFSEKTIVGGKSVYVSEGAVYINNGIDEKKVLDLDEIGLKGRHNLGNILAAVGATFVLGTEIKDIRKAIYGFEGISHRLEFVRELDGVKYYNDTAATNPRSAMAGIDSFSEPVVLICGGADKNLDMDDFAKKISENTKAAIFLKGKATDKIIAGIKKISPKEEDFAVVDSMEKAVAAARSVSVEGDVVLLSAGAASFGLFVDEFDRGNKFKDAVAKLK